MKLVVKNAVETDGFKVVISGNILIYEKNSAQMEIPFMFGANDTQRDQFNKSLYSKSSR